MNENPQPADVADRNVERLLTQAYQPEAPSPGFVARLEERLLATARTAAHREILPMAKHDQPADPRLQRVRWRLAAVMAAAATVACVALVMHAIQSRSERDTPTTAIAANTPAVIDPATGKEALTPKPRAAVKAPEAIVVGNVIKTELGQRRRLALPDGSILYVNQNTEVRLDQNRRLKLTAGEVFIEVAPRDAKAAGANFVVQTPRREVTATGTKFRVQADNAGRAAVLVTQGSVRVDDVAEPITAGQTLDADKTTFAPAARASHLLDWTRELMAAAETPLVPDSKYTGGALVAVDPYGQEAKLSLRNYHADVYIEDGFARTVIDQTYFNHNASRMEGTFYFPLPPDASLSRLAMYVGEDLMEGGMAEREYARGVYEEIVNSQKDPALLEWVDGSTFKMRVFPLEARQEKRIIIGYTQRLSSLYGQSQYRFPAGHSLGLVERFSLNATIKNASALTPRLDSHAHTMEMKGNDIVLKVVEKDVKLDRDVVLDLHGTQSLSRDIVRFSGMAQDGNRYLMLRYQPQLLVQRQRQSRDWVFLFEASGDRDPLVARVQIDVIRALLANAEHDDTFAVLAAGTRVKNFSDKPVRVTPGNVKAAIEFLESQHLIGALDLAQAFDAARPLLAGAANPHLVHVGTGIAAMGEKRIDILGKRVPDNVRYVGVGVGKRWARDFMKSTAERTGGYFTQINPDEAVGWRAFELAATLNTPRLMNLTVEAKDSPAKFLNFGSALAQGEELCSVARLTEGQPMPQFVTVRGLLDGKPFVEELAVQQGTGDAGFLPRTWSKLEIERLLAETGTDNKKAITTLSKAMYVMSPYTSLLVLENADMYARFKVDTGRQDHWAAYDSPKKIKVVYEPMEGQNVDRFAPRAEKPHVNQILETILVRVKPSLLTWPQRHDQFRHWTVTTALQVYRGGFGLGSTSKLGGGGEGAGWNLSNAEWGQDAVGANDGLPTTFNIDRINDIVLAGDRPVSNKSKGMEKLEELQKSAKDEKQAMPGRNGATRHHFLREGGERAAQDRGFRSVDGDRKEQFSQSMINALSSRGADKLKLLAEAAPKPPMAPPRQGKKDQLAEAEQILSILINGDQGGPRMYGRPSFSGDERVFFDLLSYAPGLNTTDADIEAVKENEAAPALNNLPGRIDPAARKLIDAARAGGWRTLKVEKDGPAYTITFDGQGRYAYDRRLANGLREQVVNDGKTLVHLYPDLGLGARRTPSRFHRGDLSTLVPWVLPTPEELARGADLKVVSDSVVAIEPRGAADLKDDDGKAVPYARMQLVFAADGKLSERQLIEMPANSVLFREIYNQEKGESQLLNAEGTTWSKAERKLADAAAPNLTPDDAKLVVLSLPYRQREKAYAAHGIQRHWLYDDNVAWTFGFLDERAATDLFAAEFIAQDWHAAQLVYRRCFAVNDNRKLGFFTVLAASNLQFAGEVDFQKTYAENPGNPLATYLGLLLNPKYRVLQQRFGLHLGETVAADSPFLHRLSVYRDLYLRWSSNQANRGSAASRRAEQERAFRFVADNQSSVFGYMMLSLLNDRADSAEFHAAVAQAWKQFQNGNDLSYYAEYEHARAMRRAGKSGIAAALFVELYEKALKEGRLPALDQEFRSTLQADGQTDGWSAFMRKTADCLVREKHRPAVVTLAWQAWQLGDAPLSENLLATALRGIDDDADRLTVTATALEFLTATNQNEQADALLLPLLEHANFKKMPLLWRAAARIAERRGLTARSIRCLETALDIEYQNLPSVVNLQQLRGDYGTLLNHYQWLAGAVATMKMEPPTDLLPRTVKAADRWRALDRDNSQPCDQAARVLKTLGHNDLAWDYLTTPIGQRPNEGGPWRSLAQSLAFQGDLTLADRAYKAASEAEPTDAQLLWDRAQNLRRQGKLAESHQLLRQIVQGEWPRFNNLKAQARWQLEGR